jgi:hypothetical protein
MNPNFEQVAHATYDAVLAHTEKEWHIELRKSSMFRQTLRISPILLSACHLSEIFLN